MTATDPDQPRGIDPPGVIATDPDQRRRIGPVAPSAGGAAVLWPLPFRLDGGFWAARQRVNTAHSIGHGMRQLRTHGQWDDFRYAAGRQTGVHSGRPYTDSDIYKMAEAIAWDTERGGQDGTEAIAEIAALVADAQLPSGYLNTWFQCTGTDHFSDMRMGHELYCAGHLIQAAVAAARAGADSGLVAVAIRFADHLVDTFGTGADPGLCGHAEIETALVELYRLTGHRPYLALAARMIDRRGYGLLGPGHYGAAYYQDDAPIREARELDGHCVRALYFATGATDVYLETGDPTLLAALTRLWSHTLATKTYLTGGVGCRRKTEAFGAPYELPPDHAFNETCAGVANLMWSWRLLLATGEAVYADHIERILFNVIAAGVSERGERFSYINTLHRRGAAMETGDKAPYRKPWFGCACCPPNLMRTLASLDHYIATTDAEGIQLHQYADGSVHTAALGLDVRTDYPWSGRVAITVTAADGQRTLALRVPAWCRDATVEVNGSPADVPVRGGYLSVRRRWRTGDRVTLDLAMPPRLTWPHPRIDAVRGCVAIERGPLVYCVEDTDLPAGVHLDGLRLRPDEPMRVDVRDDLLGGVISIAATARRQPDTGTSTWPYGASRHPVDDRPGSSRGAGRAEPGAPEGPSEGPSEGSSVALTAIPYYAWDNRDRGMMRVWLPVGA
ncbi:glycoside hydrolase family 127 protein [Rugosimonospora africana]|uniref:Glycoside hydrolase family 127 protein n=1 Tax=Rugosimonospora africana TaxID=556532 RepID=A0A8J3QQ33_9ACTN|nr:beta-L-arabinofuranosidase domain-containing protein [Rugosimonospora africana]GIH14883.1 hypothetical protein Raf01_30550 [Rugosimonospora africana]